MKKTFFIISFISALYTNIFAADKELTNLGLISQLVEIKYSSEAYLSSILNDESKKEKDIDIARKNYNAVRFQIDRIIYQLSADIRAKNSIKKYSGLDKYYKTHRLVEYASAKSGYKPYAVALAAAYSTYKEKIYPDVSANSPKFFIEADVVLSVVELGWTIITDIHEMRGQKVDGIVEIINNLRLNPPSELDKKNQEEEKSK